MIRDHAGAVGPRVEMQMLILGRAARRQRRADVHVVELLGVHVVGAMIIMQISKTVSACLPR